MRRSLAIITLLGGLLWAGCHTADQGAKWEYRTATTSDEVKQLASQGWTVVNFSMPNGGSGQYLMKRPKQQ